MPRKSHRPTGKKGSPGKSGKEPEGRSADTLRIIGGRFGGRKLKYSGDSRTRPMKQRVREAIFNLVGPAVKGMHAVDLFAGTGALGLESLSRGSVGATFIEQHRPTAMIIRQNLVTLGVESICELVISDTFFWGRQDRVAASEPWLIFCSPPYSFYVERTEEMLQLITGVIAKAPPQSVIVVEADETFDMELLPTALSSDADPDQAWQWDVRTYSPAVVAIADLPGAGAAK